jgi:hypothetical protein
LSGNNGVFQCQPRSEVLAGGSFDDESEARSKPGHSFALELTESVNETAQSSGFRCAELAQQRHELVGFEQVEYTLGGARQAGQVDRLDQPQNVALGDGAIDVCLAGVPFSLDQAVGHAGGITAQRVPAEGSANAPGHMVGDGGDPILQPRRGFAIHHDDG